MVTLSPRRGRAERAVLTSAERVGIHEAVAQVERDTTAEICVMLVRDARDPAALAAQYFAHLGVGKKDLDNGILILVVLAGRRIEIVVGRGLAEVLPHALLEHVLTTILAPHFEAARFGAGLVLAVEAFGRVLRERFPKTPPGEPGKLPNVVDLDIGAQDH